MLKKISDMMDYIQDDSVNLQEKDIVSSERIKEVTMKKLHEQKKKNKKMKLPQIIGTAAVLAVVCSVTAGASVGFIRYENPQEMLNAFFGTNGTASYEGAVVYNEDGALVLNLPAWERVPVDETLADELITPYISGEKDSLTYRGYTVTLEANLYDTLTQSGLVYYSVEIPEDVENAYYVYEDGEIVWNSKPASLSVGTAQPGRTYIDQTLSTDTKLYICEYYIVNDLETLDELALEIREYTEDSALLKGSLQFHPAVSQETPGLVLENGAIKISPIGIQMEESALDLDPESDVDFIIFQYKDGSEYILEDDEAFVSNRAYALDNGEKSTYLFNRIVDINSLKSVTIEDKVYEIE